ncbi:MAG: TetR/AcrR family transcriptional regulator [Solirubrobacteraceae bacterium]
MTGTPGRKRKGSAPEEQQLRSGRHGLAREAVVSNQRERIMKALVATIATYGFDGSTVERIAKRAGVSRRTFYEQFTDREDAYLYTYDTAAGRLLQRVNEAWAQNADGAEQLRLWLRALLECLTEEAQLARVCIVDVLSAGPRALEHRERHMHNFAVPLEEAAIEHNGAPAPALAADGLVAAIYDAIYKLLVQDRSDELGDLLEDLHSFCLMLFQYSPSPTPAPVVPEPR